MIGEELVSRNDIKKLSQNSGRGGDSGQNDEGWQTKTKPLVN